MFREKGLPSSNNPDDVPRLQELARTDAELHLAYAADLLARPTPPSADTAAGGAGRSSKEQRARAEVQWESGCIRLEAFVTDAEARVSEEAALRAQEADVAIAAGKEVGSTMRASSVASSVFNTPALARLNGMDPESPFVTQRPQSAYSTPTHIDHQPPCPFVSFVPSVGSPLLTLMHVGAPEAVCACVLL